MRPQATMERTAKSAKFVHFVSCMKITAVRVTVRLNANIDYIVLAAQCAVFRCRGHCRGHHLAHSRAFLSLMAQMLRRRSRKFEIESRSKSFTHRHAFVRRELHGAEIILQIHP